MALSLPNLEKLSQSERDELAAKLRKDAEAEEAAAEVAQKEYESAKKRYDAHCDQAYNLRVLARTVEQYKKP